MEGDGGQAWQGIGWIRCAMRRMRFGRRGTVALEFGLVAPVLLTLVIGGVKFGFAVNNYMMLTTAAEQGAQTLANSRGSTTPYTDSQNAITNAAMNLAGSNIGITLAVGAPSCTSGNSCTICTSDSTCQSAITASGQVALVTLTYPCDLVVMGINFGGSSCQLSAQSAAVVQ